MRRQLDLAPPADAAEAQRLAALLGAGGELLALNAELCARIERGEIDLATPGLAAHLMATTLAKFAVDPAGPTPDTAPPWPRPWRGQGLNQNYDARRRISPRHRTSSTTWPSSTWRSSRRRSVSLENQDDNIRFFDHRREHARTDWDNNGLPRREWEALLAEARRRADAAGHLRYAWPVEWGGKGGTNLAMAVIREHLAAKGLGLRQRSADRAFDRRQQPLHHHVQASSPPTPSTSAMARPCRRARPAPSLTQLSPTTARTPRFMETSGRCAMDKDGIAGWRTNWPGRCGPPACIVANYIMTFARHCSRERRRRRRDNVLSSGPGRRAGVDDQRSICGLQHAHRPPASEPHRRLGERGCDLGRRGPGPGSGAELRPPEPHPPGGLLARRGGLFGVEEQQEIRAPAQAPSASCWSDNLVRSSGCWSNWRTQWRELLRLLIRKTAWEVGDHLPHKEVERQISGQGLDAGNYWSVRLVQARRPTGRCRSTA